ncbi:myb-like protein X [Spodoptera litura]|uniref:Myb-like protein X n=1 Tax=Spodoptera litura TaxID=69820 RepID=A0A9J7J1U6_SPOLT|nr:myb-like protein X [Spodoptera litura]
MYNVIAYYFFVVYICDSKMSAIPIPRKTSSEKYDVDGFIDQLLASRKFDELTEVFADKAAYKIKNLDNPPTARTDIERIRWSKKSHKNTNKEQFKDDHTHTELISIKLRDDDTHSKESRKRNPTISLNDGEISPNENLRLKYKYLTKTAKTKNSTDHNKVMILEKKENNEKHALNDDENIDLKEEAKNEDQNDPNGSHEKHEQYYNDRDGDLHYKSAKIDHVWDKEEHKYEHSFQEDLNKSEHSHLHMDDNAKDGTHPNEEHTDRVSPEFKSKAYSVEHEHAHNTSDEISEENFQGVASDEKSHEEIDHRKEVTLMREPTTTRFKVEAVTNVTNITIQKDHTNDDMIGTAHFRAQISEEQVQAKSEEKERRIRNLPDSELKKLLKQHPTDKEMRILNEKLEFTQVKQDSKKPEETERNQKDKLEKEKREREGLEKILKDRLEEEERLRNAAVIYERSEREQRALFGVPEIDESVEEIPSDVVIMGDINMHETPRHILEKEIREESKRQEKQHAEWAKKVEKELEEHKEMMKKESDKYHKEAQERLSKVLKDKEKVETEMAESSKAYVAANLEQANKVLKEKAKYDELMKEESDKNKKHQYDRLKELLKEKAKYEEEMKQGSMLLAKQAKERLAKILGPKKTFIEKVIDKKKEVENKIKGINVKPLKAKKKGPEKGTKKKEPKKEKKNESTKEKKKAKEFNYSDYRAEEEQINTKEKQRQYRDQKEYENKLEREIREDDESSIESESEVDKQTELQGIPGSKPSFNKVNIEPYKNVEDEYNNRIAESESAANDDDQSSGEDELVIMSSTTNPIIRKEGNKEYTFVQNPEYAEYHEAYAKMQKEHPFNPADFLQ